MKTWLFAVLESVIALLGLAAYLFADNVVLTASAVAAAACLGVFQSLSSARQKTRLDAFQEQQFQKSVGAVDEQLQTLQEELIPPPWPHHPTVSAVLRSRFGEQACSLLEEYDRLVEAVAVGRTKAETLTNEFADKVADWSVGPYLQGLVCLMNEKVGPAREHFLAAQEAQSTWIAPWLGWATAAARQGRWDEIREQHPHLNGVEMLPYDAGDEQSFIALDEQERETVTDSFQQAARSLGNYYTIAELSRSKGQMFDSRAEFKKAA